jgi:LysM repeat protein
VKFAFFCVVGVHVAALMVALLSQGCKRDQTTTTENPRLPTIDTNLPVMDTNPPPSVPATSAPPVAIDQLPPTAPPNAQEYVIQRGDSYSTIAKKYPGVTVKAIQDANPGVDPLKLQPGKKIMIPAATVAPVVAPNGSAVSPVAATGDQPYVVKSGDTLTTIASRHGTTVKALRAANNLTTDKIKVGQKLKIPVKAAPPVDTVPAAPPAAR